MKGAFNSWSVVLCCSLDPHLKVDQERKKNHGLPSLQKETVWLIKLLCLAWAGRNCIVSFKAWRSNARVSWHLVWCQALPVSQLLLPLLKYESKRSCVPPPSHHHGLNLTAWTGKILLHLQLKLYLWWQYSEKCFVLIISGTIHSYSLRSAKRKVSLVFRDQNKQH